MSQPLHPATEVGNIVQSDLDGDVPLLAERLFGKNQPDSTSMSDAAYTQLVQQNWANPQFREAQASARPEDFLKAFRALGGVLPGEDGHSMTPPPSGPASAMPGGPQVQALDQTAAVPVPAQVPPG